MLQHSSQSLTGMLLKRNSKNNIHLVPFKNTLNSVCFFHMFYVQLILGGR